MADETEDTGEAQEGGTQPARGPAALQGGRSSAATPPHEVLAPKERRQRARSAKAARVPVGPVRSAAQRHDGRLAERQEKAKARRVVRQRARAKARSSQGALEATPPREREPGRQKTRRGVVVSNRAEKTISVRIDTARRHRSYAKIVRTSTTLHAHDAGSDANIGDTVLVRECRPLSRTKRWRLVEVIARAK